MAPITGHNRDAPKVQSLVHLGGWPVAAAGIGPNIGAMGDRLAGSKERGHDGGCATPQVIGGPPNLAGPGNRVLARLLLQRQEDADSSSFANRLHASRSGGRHLPADVARRLAPHVGAATGSIRVHADGNADVLARAVNAVAFTTGRDIFFRSGAYRPRTASGLQLLAHEATHVAQQAAGPVSGTLMGGGLSVSDPSDRFEREAAEVARGVE